MKDLEIMLDDEKNKSQSLANLNAELNIKIESLALGQHPEIVLIFISLFLNF